MMQLSGRNRRSTDDFSGGQGQGFQLESKQTFPENAKKSQENPNVDMVD